MALVITFVLVIKIDFWFKEVICMSRINFIGKKWKAAADEALPVQPG